MRQCGGAEPKSLIDNLVEGSIVGSFTKIGYSVRSKLFDWEDIESDLSGKHVIVTGATSGIGRATAAGLLRLGAQVHITSRSSERAEAVAAELNAESVEGSATGHALDTGSRTSILAFAEKMGQLEGDIEVLINNAGALTSNYDTDENGTELTLVTHLIGPYLLTMELRPHLATGARVLFMSSGGMYTQKLDVQNIELNKADYSGAIAYAKAKRGQVELVTHLGPEWAPDVIMHSVHPGWVDTPGVDAGIPGFGKVMGPLLRTPDQGADTMVWLAATGGGGAKPGQFWLDRHPRRTCYLPGTCASTSERRKLVKWLDSMIA